MSGFFLALGAVGVGAYAATRPRKQTGLNGILDLASNPAVFGLGAGVVNGVLATVREKPMSITANLVTAAVIGISEGILAENRDSAARVGVMSALGAAAGMSLFTRFDPEERAIFENPAIPLLG